MEPRSAALAPFRLPVFRNIWLASLLSSFGGVIQSVGAAWLMLELTRQADMVALVQTSVALPIVLLALLGGAVADSWDRRRVMLAAQAFMLLVSVALAVCAGLGWISPWLLLLFTFLIGCGNSFNAPAWQALVQDMVPRQQLPSAVSLNSMGFNLARSLGPALGGAIVALVGAAAAFAVNALSYLGLIGVLARWRPVDEPRLLPREPLLSAMGAGVRYVRLSPAIRTVLLRSLTFGLGASAALALLPTIASRLVGGGALDYGLLLGAFGIGAVLAALGSANLRDRMSTESLVRVATLGFALALVMAAGSAALWLCALAMLVAGAGWVLALSTFNVAVQLAAPRWVVARALSLYQMAAFGGLAGGSWLWGGVAEGQGLPVALAGAAVTLVLSALLGLLLPLEQTGQRNLDPLRQFREPATEVPVQPRTGPVVVTVEWIIEEADIVPFLHAMSERRRIRRRDGAHQWALLRDLNDPRLWIERFKTATWMDYLRHSSRITRDDADVPERLRALHRGEGPPRVRRMIERPTSRLPESHHAGHESDHHSSDPTRHV
ncbi:MFS transporter [Pseudomarimonas salicorniae]|uniref:MFS transporter n=1 Tax=Pseudomarimonas salicorniae TaxID=2933270 RepID=A0ABT0GHP7_9GAMM|nr:MFS transporter [Lysobacter sp. CAU 1642]MCK7594063.1 MFS transporter [Lysobacter sp. CAU 1642]